MLQGLLLTHGRLGETLRDTAEGILGSREGLQVLSNHGLSREGLVADVKACFEHLPPEDLLLVLTDMPGGSPHVAARLALKAVEPQLAGRVLGPLAGVNLPLLLTFLNRREGTGPEELLALLLDRGRAGIQL